MAKFPSPTARSEENPDGIVATIQNATRSVVLERGEPALQEVGGPHCVPASPHRPSQQEIEARAPLPPDSPAAEQPELPAQAEEKQPEASGKGRRNGLLHRRPVVWAIGAMLLASALGGGYVYVSMGH